LEETIKKRSPLWYELPILFAIVGGVIAYFKIKKDDPKKAKRCIYVGIIFSVPVVFGIGMAIMGGVVLGTTNPFYVISSGSMYPELQVFDVAVIQANDPFESVKVGDIIVFYRPEDHARIIIARADTIISEDPFTVRTKGDANPASIPGTDFPITEEEYIGKVAYVIPEAGYITRILSPPINYIFSVMQFVIFFIPIALHIKFRRENKRSSNTKDEKSNGDSG